MCTCTMVASTSTRLESKDFWICQETVHPKEKDPAFVLSLLSDLGSFARTSLSMKHFLFFFAFTSRLQIFCTLFQILLYIDAVCHGALVIYPFPFFFALGLPWPFCSSVYCSGFSVLIPRLVTPPAFPFNQDSLAS